MIVGKQKTPALQLTKEARGEREVQGEVRLLLLPMQTWSVAPAAAVSTAGRGLVCGGGRGGGVSIRSVRTARRVLSAVAHPDGRIHDYAPPVVRRGAGQRMYRELGWEMPSCSSEWRGSSNIGPLKKTNKTLNAGLWGIVDNTNSSSYVIRDKSRRSARLLLHHSG